MNNEEIRLLDIQIVATYLFVISLAISLIITYNDKCKTLKKKPILNDNNAYSLSVFNRIFVIGISLSYLYVNYKNREISKQKGLNLQPFNLQIISSELTILAGIIVLYVIISSGEYTIIASSENPGL